ncbi:hypothetical protein P7K49_007474, partial [Saguinus oedipus]
EWNEMGKLGAGRAPPKPVCGQLCKAAWEEDGGEPTSIWFLTLDNAMDEKALEQGL